MKLNYLWKDRWAKKGYVWVFPLQIIQYNFFFFFKEEEAKNACLFNFVLITIYWSYSVPDISRSPLHSTPDTPSPDYICITAYNINKYWCVTSTTRSPTGIDTVVLLRFIFKYVCDVDNWFFFFNSLHLLNDFYCYHVCMQLTYRMLVHMTVRMRVHGNKL